LAWTPKRQWQSRPEHRPVCSFLDHPSGLKARRLRQIQERSVSEFHQAAGPVDASVESDGFFDVAPTPSGKGWLHWKSDDIGVSIQGNGLVFWLPTSPMEIRTIQKLGTLVYPDRIAISPTTEMAAVTSGLGRESWANQAIAIST
jgi:hypothetical protein